MLIKRIVTKSESSIVAKLSMLLLLGASVFVSGVTAAEKFTLNFKGADIKAVITSVADITGKNFIVDPRVKGKATIISKRAMSKGEVYQVFLSVLEVHGYTAVPSGKTIKIIPDADAKHSGMPTVSEDDPGIGDEAVTRVIQIEHVTAAQLVPILRPLVPPQGHLAAYPQSNVLIISDRVRNINRLLSIIKRIDQPSSGEIEIVALEHAAASDLVRVLNSLQQQKNQKGAKGSKPTLVADERTNSILIGGDRSQRLQLRAIISHLDTPSEVTGDTHVIYLRYAKAKDLVTVLTGVAESKKKAGGKGKKGRGAVQAGAVLNIQADESSNALVITASPTVFRSLESVVRQLDVRRAQVMVEAIIAEVAVENSASLGVRWLFDGSNNDQPVGAIDFGGGFAQAAGAAIASGGGERTNASNAAAVVSILGGGASMAFGRFSSTDGFNFAGILNALQSDGNTNVLSTPSLVTLDNEEAEIFIGQEVSIPTGSFSGTGSGGGGASGSNPFTTFERKPVGISLKVKPQINEGDAIQLEIEQKVDSLLSGAAGTGGLVTAERRVKTNVIVDNGSILVLGGLIKDNLLETHSKVPLLGDIPLLGFLFRSESVKKIKQNLMIFLRPTILRDAKQSLALTNSKYTALRDAQAMFNKNGSQLWLGGDLPELPDMESMLTLPPPFEETQQTKKTLFDDPEETPDALDF